MHQEMDPPPARPPERGVCGAQPPGMQGFGGAALNVGGVRGAHRPAMRGIGGQRPPAYSGTMLLKGSPI